MRFLMITLTLLLSLDDVRAEQIPVWIGMSAPRFGEPEGIYRTTLNTENGELTKPELAAEFGAPQFLAMGPNGKRVYAVCRLPDGESGVGAGGTGAALVILTFSVADGRPRTLSAETARTR